ncbi:Crp/Fnr family transcriptional regulator [Rhizorhabdus dicambivorans]|uniref:Crp/Fnr family transcriptional regulator n=1 Tax=Rhizorhabdus dicambivorans TaxID=1850238 RepID=A0A2A4FTM0_9SPHN|nr:Crp/Fnr family transcriptional regulator [Rhizorhabdus dicambivorans]ATE66464.1 Crp/Fnr family transcriptional regulator [Rhizorhabdus dicambivorans]PCE41044.1 Crp/Fnr family transcriptional regulator [Rhizorhabdus dicambivorans]
MIERLRILPGFRVLDPETIAVIAARSAVRSFVPGQRVFAAGEVADMLLARIGGRLVGADGGIPPPVFDAPGLLFGLAVTQDYLAGPEGLEAVAIAKPHVFTIAREFPEFIMSLMDDAGDAA